MRKGFFVLENSNIVPVASSVADILFFRGASDTKQFILGAGFYLNLSTPVDIGVNKRNIFGLFAWANVKTQGLGRICDTFQLDNRQTLKHSPGAG